MISLNELRVDNWVYNSYTKQNTQVYPMMIPQLQRIEKENGSLKDCNIEPIPLTEEILLKCGFDIEWLLIDCEGYYVLINNKKIRIKFVHSLQNIYLCIEQKELKLCL